MILDRVVASNDCAAMSGAADDKPGRTMEVARIEKERGSDTIVQPRELVEVRYARGVSLTLSARKILALMMHQAAGDAWRDQEHRRSEEHTSELQSLMRTSVACFCL